MTAPDATFVTITKANADSVTATVAPVCATCQWFVPDTNAIVGSRCRNGPIWHTVDADHTCGQWKWRMVDRGTVPASAYLPLDSDLTVYAWV